MNQETYQFGFQDELEKIARKIEVPEPGWQKHPGSHFWHRGTEISEKRPVERVSRIKLRRGRRRLAEIAKK